MKEDNLYVFLKLDDGTDVKENKYKFRHFFEERTLVPDKTMKEPVEPKIVEAIKPDTRIPSCDGVKPEELHAEFMRILDSFGMPYESILNDKNNVLTIKYNGYNIFKTSYNKHRFWVLCHTNSLNATLKKSSAYWSTAKKYNEKKKSGVGESLKTKFIFTDWNQRSVMKSLIRVGFEYRRIMDMTPEDYIDRLEKLKELKKEIE